MMEEIEEMVFEERGMTLVARMRREEETRRLRRSARTQLFQSREK